MSSLQPSASSSTSRRGSKAARGTGRLGGLSPEQESTLLEFKSLLSKEKLLKPGDSIGTSDADLLRWLRARQFNLHKSTELFRQAQAWRANTYQGKSMDQLYEEIDPFDFDKKAEIFKWWPMCFHGVDKLQRPINWQAFGSIKVSKLYQVASPEYHWKTVLVNCEALPREVLPAATKSAGRTVDGALCIVDLKGFSISQFWQMKDLAAACFQISQDRYPETMASVKIINAPSSFATIWKVIKGWLAPQTRDKIDILGSDYQKALLQVVNPDQLPKVLGGECQCPEGCMMSSKGPWKTDRSRRRPGSVMEDSHDEKADAAAAAAPQANGHAPEGAAPAAKSVATSGGVSSPPIAPPQTPFVDAPQASPKLLNKARDDDGVQPTL